MAFVAIKPTTIHSSNTIIQILITNTQIFNFNIRIFKLIATIPLWEKKYLNDTVLFPHKNTHEIDKHCAQASLDI